MDGIIVINKEKEYTSHDVVAKLKKKLNISKVGHTGTSPVRLGLDGFGLSQRRAGLIDPGFHFGAVDDQQEISLSDAGSVSHKLFQYPARELGGNIHARGVDFALREVPVIRDVKHAGHGQQNDGKTYQAEKNCGGGCGFFHHKFLYGWPC